MAADRHELFATEQSLRETWHVCTRATSANGFGYPPKAAAALIEELARNFTILYGSEESLGLWLDLVTRNSISGATAHDANHAAIAVTEKIDVILTLDARDFRRFGLTTPAIVNPLQDA